MESGALLPPRSRVMLIHVSVDHTVAGYQTWSGGHHSVARSLGRLAWRLLVLGLGVLASLAGLCAGGWPNLLVMAVGSSSVPCHCLVAFVTLLCRGAHVVLVWLFTLVEVDAMLVNKIEGGPVCWVHLPSILVQQCLCYF
jgi:hypothetical protein